MKIMGCFVNQYQLLKYKPWEHTPDNAWNNLEQCVDTYKTCWMNFLCSDYGKALGLELKLQNLNVSVKLFCSPQTKRWGNRPPFLAT